MKIHTIVVGDFQVNCYVLETTPGKAVVIDPGDEGEKIAGFLKHNRLAPLSYLMTHGHVDHIAALHEVSSLLPAPIAMHGDDAKWAFGEESRIVPYLDIPAEPEEIALDLKDCTEVPGLGERCEVIHTPGHTPGSVCFYFRDCGVLITGDTLFAGSVGRTDFPGGDTRTLAKSLRKLKALPDDTQIFPGHGPSSTIVHEKMTNYFLQMR
jgi:glyoxylase-like metal-dependent hydrolase (beta-lactamase superfamily II)